MDSNTRQSAMRAILASLTDPADGWTWIGRTAYRRGPRGVFRLDVDSHGHADHVNGLRGTYIPHVGGEPDRILFLFVDLLETKASTYQGKPHPAYEGRPCSIYESTWAWGISVPLHIEPLHDAIREWTFTHDVTAAELESWAREDAGADRKRAARKPRAVRS